MRLVGCGLAFVGVLFAACVSNAPPPGQGELDGPCFANSTCNAGLVCQLVSGTATCLNPDGATTNDASTATDSASASDGGDGGLPVCKFSPTVWPSQCPGGPTGAACFGAAQDCSLTSCAGERWECFSPNQCSQAPCCISASAGVLTPQHDCSQGAITMVKSTPSGSVCGSGSACGSDDAGPQIQLCQFNYQCPTGQICSAVKVVSSDAASINGSLIGACMAP